MKVAFINHPLAFPVPPQSGAVQMCAHAIATRVARANDVIVYSLGADFPETEWCERVAYRRVSIPGWVQGGRWRRRLNRVPVLWRLNPSPARSRWHHWGYCWAVASDLRAQKCDVIHIMNLFHFAPLIRHFNRKSKIVLHMHCQWLNRLDPALVAPRLAHVDLILGCSEYITDKIRDAFPQFAGRCRTVHNGVDPRSFAPAPPSGNGSQARKRILWTGRISPEKGLHVLLEAFAQVLKRYSKIELEIIGPEEPMPFESLLECDAADIMSPLAEFYDGTSYLFRLRQRAASLGIADRITFRGLTSHDKLVERYLDAVMLVNASFSETFGMPLVEAMSCELPVVAARAGGMTEVINDGECGLLVEPGDASALASAIVRLLEDDSLRESMGKAGRRRVLKHFSWDRIADAVMDEYCEVLEGSTAPRRGLPSRSTPMVNAVNSSRSESVTHPPL